jgi:hypothetical protein
MTITRGGTVVVSVDEDGTISNRGKVIGQWAAGVLRDPKGKTVLAVAVKGEVWARDRLLGRITGDKLVFEAGGTLSIDARGTLTLANGSKRQVSTDKLDVERRGRKLALVIAFLSGASIHYKRE